MDRNIHLVLLLSGPCSLSSCVPRHRCAFVNKTKTWDEAQSYCREKYLDLATIDDMSEMKRVLKALENEGAVSVWIGLKSGTDLSSHWSLADKDFYKEGERNYFNWSSTITGNCASFQKGKLHTEDCLAKQYPICFDGNKHGREQYVLIKLNMSWPGARDYCRTHHTDLTSVRNEEENQKIQEVAGDLTVWVGLFTDTFKWSDQSNSSFRYWTAGDMFGDGGGGCVALSIVHSGRWEKQPCHWLRRVFCNCPVVSFVKVRISAQDLDLNGPAAQEHILKQIKQKLSNNNVTHGSLRWKKQPDGTVLTKEPNQGG